MMITIVIILLIVVLLLFLNTKECYESKYYFNVINVPGEMGQLRRDYIKDVFTKANINYILHPGYNKNEIKVPSNTGITDGDYVLSMTHNDLYKKLLASRDKYMLIAEDDCTFRPNFSVYLDKILNNLPVDFDVIKLGYISKFDENGKYNTEDNPDVPYDDTTEIILKKDVFYYGTECYIISRKGAEYFLKLNEPIWLVADWIFDKTKQTKMDRLADVYYATPPLAWQGNVPVIK